MINYQKEYRKLLKHHAEMGYLRDPRMQRILEEIPLDYILEENQLKRYVLTDSPALFYYKDNNNARTISAPHMVSMMLSMLELNPNDKVLILGSKGGLLETAIAKAVSEVYIVEEHEEVASITEEAFIRLGMKNIWVNRGNPYMGLSEKAPFDKILITGAVPFIKKELMNQVKYNGIAAFPMMISSPNHQIIFQVVNREKKNKIINFGTVIFSPLFSKKVPKMDQNKDFTLKNIIDYAKQHPNKYILKEKPFFEEYRKLPNLEIYQIKFQASNGILLTIPTEEHKQELFLKLYIENPENENYTISIDCDIARLAYHQTKEKIILKPGDSNEVLFKIPILLKEEAVSIKFTIIDEYQYRINSVDVILHTLQDKSGWNFSIEFIPSF